MNIKPADIVGIPFPYTDLSARKKRPVLVLTHLDHRGDFIALPVTSVQMQQLALCIDENSIKNGNLPKTSWVRYDKIFTLNVSLAKKKYGSLHSHVFQTVMSHLCSHLGCLDENLAL